MPKESRNVARIKRHKRVRNKVFGTEERPRLNIFIALIIFMFRLSMARPPGPWLQHQAWTLNKGTMAGGGNIAAAREVGTLLAQKALAKGITKVVFDRGGYKYHGRVAALAEAAREAGLDF